MLISSARMSGERTRVMRMRRKNEGIRARANGIEY